VDLDYDAENPANSSVEARIEVASFEAGRAADGGSGVSGRPSQCDSCRLAAFG
jgi:hypothetical protein